MEWRYRHTVLLLVVAGNFTQLGTRLSLSPVVPGILEAFAVSKGAVGLALTGMWAAYALFQLPGGLLGDRFGERPVIVAGLVGAALGSLLVAASPAFVLFGVFALCLGAGTGTLFPAAASLLTREFENTGRALGFLTAGGALAGLVAPVAAAAVGVRYGWRAAPLLGVVAAVPVALVFVRYVRPMPPERPDDPVRDRFDPGVLVALLSRPRVAYTTLIAVVGVFTFQAVASFFPTFLVEHHGFSTGDAGVAFGAVFLLSAVVQPAVGNVSDAIGRDAAIALTMLVAAVGIGLAVAGGPLLAVVGVAVLGVGISWPGALQARFMDALSAAERGIGFGLVRTVYLFLGASGSVVTGVLADAAGWTAAYGLVGGLLGCAVVALLANRALGLGL